MSSYNPLFSVIVPVYNRAHTVTATLESVRSQTLGDFECVVVDDGSVDGSRLETTVEELFDERFRYVRRENGGGGAARNTGIDVARGCYIAFLDSDDLFLPDKLAHFSELVSGDGRDAWYSPALVDRGSAARWIRPSQAIGSDEDMGEYLFVSNHFVQTSTIVIGAAIAKTVRFDPGLRKGQDLDFCVRLHAAGVRFRMTEHPLIIWRDALEGDRTSRTAGYAAPIEWLERSRAILTSKAVLGYRATYLAYYLADAHPITALSYIMQGWFRAGVPAKVIFRQLLRCFLPRRPYRAAVDRFVSIFGTKATPG